MGSRRRCRRVCGGGRAVRHLATDAEDADCGASSGDRACRSSSQAWREGMRSSRQAWAKCTGSDGDARGGEWQHQTAALSCTCRTWHWCSKRGLPQVTKQSAAQALRPLTEQELALKHFFNRSKIELRYTAVLTSQETQPRDTDSRRFDSA